MRAANSLTLSVTLLAACSGEAFSPEAGERAMWRAPQRSSATPLRSTTTPCSIFLALNRRLWLGLARGIALLVAAFGLFLVVAALRLRVVERAGGCGEDTRGDGQSEQTCHEIAGEVRHGRTSFGLGTRLVKCAASSAFELPGCRPTLAGIRAILAVFAFRIRFAILGRHATKPAPQLATLIAMLAVGIARAGPGVRRIDGA